MCLIAVKIAGSGNGEFSRIRNGIVTKGGGALCAGNAVALLVFDPVMP